MISHICGDRIRCVNNDKVTLFLRKNEKDGIKVEGKDFPRQKKMKIFKIGVEKP